MTGPTDVTIEQLTADFNTYATDVTAAIGNISTQLATVQQELADALANPGNTIPAALQTAINDLDTSVKAADAAVTTPVVPVPEPPVV